MARLPYNPQKQRGYPRIPFRPRRRSHFNWSLVLVPLALILAYWVINRVKPAFTWQELLEFFNVKWYLHRCWSQLAVLGVTLLALIMVISIMRNKRK